ncbi:MAG TPA: TIGR03943 family protein, partial [Candidatus Brocadiia bacterium]|nr:TIGR03943 family protein [Candidatus Brocadiia bacterium]
GIRLGLLAAPLIYLLGMGNARLDAAAFHSRSVSLEAPAPASSLAPTRDKSKAGPPTPPATGGKSGALSAEPAAESENGAEELTIVELLRNPDSHLGQRVTATGMVLRDERVLKVIGEKRFLLFRFVITCCAADAVPAAVAVEEVSPGKWEDSQWLSVTGEFGFVEKDEKRVPVLRKATVKPIEAPEEPYLY